FALYNIKDEKEKVEVHIIDWNGNPVSKLVLDRYVRYITVDTENKVLYGINDVSENLYKYDISQCGI
ncbi:MAG: TolB-like 6-bladed beta-propeller domain-containing protein, partial [Bacteroidales bacterium]|nr:TolB-like 6-bladed beta-propeller domain-containing protein [Bacteroidales bacterium]